MSLLDVFWPDDNDDDDEGMNSWTIRLGGLLLGLMCISGFMSCQELRFITSARTCDSVVGEVKTDTDDERGDTYGLVCSVIDPATKINMTAHVPVAEHELASYPVGTPIKLQYIGNSAGDFQARRLGERHYFWVVMFFSFMTFLIGGFVWGCIHWSRAQAADKRVRRR